MAKKHYADGPYQRERRAKIKTGEIIPNAKPKRLGLADTLISGGAWLEDFDSRDKANAFQRHVSSIAHRAGIKVRCRTFTSVDPDTDTAVFIVKAQIVMPEE